MNTEHAQETRTDLTGRCVDLIEEFVFNYLRHQAVNGFYGCLTAGGGKKGDYFTSNA